MCRKLVNISGIVTPCDWAEDETIKEVTLSTNNEEEYLVSNSEKGKDLLKMIRMIVNVNGVVTEDGKGRKTITVKHYKVL